ncbi:MAG: TldD/PmbA family protein [Dehalococcoidia bacterium]
MPEPATSVLEAVRSAVDLARQAGASECDAYSVAYDESSVTVRLGELEKLIEAGSHSLGLRVIHEGRTAVSSTTDFSTSSLAALAESTVKLAEVAAPDNYAGLPHPDELAAPGGVNGLQLYDEALRSLGTDERVALAGRCEAAALAADPRITNTDGATFSSRVGEVALANSHGFAASYPATSTGLTVEVMADDAGGKKRNAYWFSSGRFLHRLPEPEAVGLIAARRAVAQLGARKVPTRAVPVVFEPLMVTDLLRLLAGCLTGTALYRGATFLAGREGAAVGSSLVSIRDDPRVPGRGGSRPFDAEGVETGPRELFQSGVFGEYLFDTYTARRAGRRTTGSAGRDTGSLPAPGSSNLIWEPGSTPASSLTDGIEEGLLVTSLMGFGFNPTTGDFSRGAAGHWIKDGEIAFPVTEINISGKMQEMLGAVEAVGDDLTWFGSSAAPSVRIAEMMVSGK